MTISPAFLQLQSFAKSEDSNLEKVLQLMENGAIATELLRSKDAVVGHYNLQMHDYIYAVTGYSDYIETKISEEIVKVSTAIADGKADISEYDLLETALYQYDTISDKVNALIDVLKPDAQYYHKILAAILVRNYLAQYDSYVSVPRSVTPSKDQLAVVAQSVNTSKLIISSSVMDNETQKYREIPLDTVVPYLKSFKGLIYTLAALQGKFLTRKEIDALELNMFKFKDSYLVFRNEFEVHGIRVVPDCENKFLELHLSTDLANLIKNEVLPLIADYEHFYTA